MPKKSKNKKTIKKEIKKKTNTGEFIKKYPGVVVAIIFSIFLIILTVWSVGIFDPNLNEKIAQGTIIHQNNQLEMDQMLEALDLLGTDYENSYDEYYLLSIKEDYLWLKQKDLEIYNKGGSDFYIKEFAVFIFMNTLLEANDELVYDYDYFNEENVISKGQGVKLAYNNFTFDEVETIFEESPSEKIIFQDTIAQLINEYEKMKKEIINGNYPTNRKYVEAKKLIILSNY